MNRVRLLNRTAKKTSIWNKNRSRAPINNSVRYRSMEIKIGHYRQNIKPTEAINDGIKSLTIIDERGTGVSAVKSKEIWKKSRKNTELWWKQA